MAATKLTDEKRELVESVVAKIPRMRSQLGINQTELANRLCLSRQTISSIERGVYLPPWDLFLAISLFFFINLRETNGYTKEMDEIRQFLKVEPGTGRYRRKKQDAKNKAEK